MENLISQTGDIVNEAEGPPPADPMAAPPAGDPMAADPMAAAPEPEPAPEPETTAERVQMARLAKEALLISPSDVDPSVIGQLNKLGEITTQNANEIIDLIENTVSVSGDVDASPEINYNKTL